MPALGGGGQGGIGGDPGAIEAAADQVRSGAVAIEDAGNSVSSHGNAVVASWEGRASDAAHERIRFLGDRARYGGDVLGDLPRVLGDYAQALRTAQANYAAGQAAAAAAATALGVATAGAAAVEAETVPGNDPAHVGRQRQAATALNAAHEAGAAASDEMAAAVAYEEAANEVATRAVNAITSQMDGMRTTMVAAPASLSTNAADWADGAPGRRQAVVKAAQLSALEGSTAPAVIAASNWFWSLGEEERDRLSTGDGPLAAYLRLQSEFRDDLTDGHHEELAGFRDGAQPFVDAYHEAREDPNGFAVQWWQGRSDLYHDLREDYVGTAVATMEDGAFYGPFIGGDIEYADGALVSGLPAMLLGIAPVSTSAATLTPPEQSAKSDRIASFKEVARQDVKELAAGQVVDVYASPPSSKAPNIIHPEEFDSGDRPLWVFPPKDPTAAQIVAAQEYADAAQVALAGGGFSPIGRISTKGRLAQQSAGAAVKERNRVAGTDRAYQGNASHVPDTTWRGRADPYSWLDLPASVNKSIGAQSKDYPIYYKPTEVIGPTDPRFIAEFGEWHH